jgi:hypothetical protein
MNDFAATLEAKSDQINNVDLIDNPMTITITKVKVNLRDDQQVSISFAESADKVYRPCKGMRRVMAQLWSADPARFIGRKLTIYRDPDVRFGKDILGGIRISAMSHIANPISVAVPVSKGKVKAYTIQPLSVADAAPPPELRAVINSEAAQSEAYAVANRGTDAFRAWFKANPDKRDAVKPIMDDLKEACAIADAGIAEDPFGLPPLGPTPTEAEIAAAMAEAERAALAQGNE